jgi:hypothetical protein
MQPAACASVKASTSEGGGKLARGEGVSPSLRGALHSGGRGRAGDGAASAVARAGNRPASRTARWRRSTRRGKSRCACRNSDARRETSVKKSSTSSGPSAPAAKHCVHRCSSRASSSTNRSTAAALASAGDGGGRDSVATGCGAEEEVLNAEEEEEEEECREEEPRRAPSMASIASSLMISLESGRGDSASSLHSPQVRSRAQHSESDAYRTQNSIRRCSSTRGVKKKTSIRSARVRGMRRQVASKSSRRDCCTRFRASVITKRTNETQTREHEIGLKRLLTSI